MDEMTQQNAALVEEASAASQSLKEEGTELLSLVSFFHLDSSPAQLAAPSLSNTVPAPATTVVRTDFSEKSKPRAKAVSGGTPLPQDNDDWQEF